MKKPGNILKEMTYTKTRLKFALIFDRKNKSISDGELCKMND